MKKLYTLSFILLATLSFGQITETFLGTGLLTANGWSNHNGLTNQLSISSGSIEYSGIFSSGNKVAFVQGNTEDVHKLLPTPIVGTTYYSVVVNMPTTVGLSTFATGDYSISLGSGPSTATSAGSLAGRIYFKVGAIADTFNIGVLNGSGGTAAPTFSATNFPINVPLFLVVKYELATNSASLFIQPTINGAEPAASLTNNTGTTAAPAQIANIALRQAGTTAGTGNVQFDNIRVADNWAYVTSGTLATKQNTITGLKVYANNNYLYVTSDSNDVKSVMVYNILGKNVVNTKVANQAINVADLSSGIYIVKVTENGKTSTVKVVLQ
jgi:Secretion system C-terminal sorting domain